MNKVFKVIWNEARNAYVVVSEIAKNRGSKSCSTKKLLAMLIATGVMTCASFDVLAAPPSAAETAQSQYVAFGDKTADLINGQEQKFDGHNYIYDATNKYWVREGYKLMVDENGKLHTPLSAHGKAADVAYIGGGDTGSILQSVTSMVSASGTVTNMGESLSRITASAFTGVSHSGGTAVVGDWNYIIQDSSWKDSDSVASGNYKDGYVDLIGPEGGMPKGFVTVGDKLKWDDTKQAYTYNGKPVDYSNVYVIDGKIGVFTNQSGSDFYKGTVFGKNNEILMTVKDADNNFYSYWASEVTDPSATMQSYRLAEYKKDLAVLVENDNKLHRDDIKEVTMTTDAGTNSAIIGLVRNGNTEAGAPVKGAITVTSGGGAGGKDTFVKISNGTANQTFATGSKVEAIGTTEATTGIKINGQEYTIKSGSVVSVAKDAANKTTTITVDGNATTITDTDTTYTAGDGIKINVGAISVSKNLTGMQSIQGAGEGKISFDGANVKVNNTTFGENSVVVGGGTDGKTPVTINGTDGVVSGLHNTNIGYTDFATKGNAATEEQLKKVMDAGWKFTTDSGTQTTVTVGEAGNEVKFNGDTANIEVTNTGKDIKVALKKNLTVDSVKAGDFFMDKTQGVGYDGKAYITSSGLNANNQKITGVAAGNADTDAVNFGQLKKVSNNSVNIDFTNISNNGKTEIVNIAKAADVHVKDGQYSVQEDGTVTMKYVDGNGNEVTGKELKITDVASAAKLDVLNTTVTDIGGRVTTNSTNITNLQGEVIISGSIGANGKVELIKDNGSKVEVGTVKDYSVTSGTYDQTTKKLTLTKTDAYGNATLGTVDIDLSGIQSGDKNWTAQANGTDVKPNADNKVNFINGDNTTVTTSGDGVIAVNLNKNLTGLTSVTTNNAYVTNVDNNNNNSVTNVQYVNEQIAGVTLTAGDGISINSKKINVKLKDGEENLVVDDKGLSLKKQLTGMESITGVGAGSISFADGGIKLNNKVNIDNTGKITGVAAGKISADSTDAVNGSQLNAVATEAGKHSKVVNGNNINVEETTVDGQKVYKVNLNNNVMVGDVTGKYVSISGTNGTVEATGAIATKDRVYADKGGKLADIDVTGNTISNGASSIVLDGSDVKVNDKVTIDQNGKISGVAAGKISADSTDAVNGSQLHAVAAEAGKHSKVVNGTNINIEETDVEGQKFYKVNLNKDILLGDLTGKYVNISGTNGTIETTGSIATKDRVYADKGGKLADIDVTGNKISNGASSIVLDGSDVKVNDKVTIDQNGKISGVAAGKISADSTDAVNGSQLHAVATEAGKHSKVVSGNNINVEETDVDGQKFYKVNLNKDIMLGDLTGKYVSISGTNGTIETTGYIATKDRVYADKGAKLADIDVTGNKISNGASSIVLDGSNVKVNDKVTIDQNGKISGVAAGVADTDAVNVGQLKEAVEAGNTDTHIKAGEYGVGADNTVNMDVVDKNGNKVDTVTIKDVAKASDVGDVNNIASDIKNKEGKTTVVDAVNNLNQKLDNKVGDLNYVEGGKGNYVTNGENTTTSIGKLDQALKDVADTANQGWNLSTNGGGASKVAPGKTVDFSGDKNIKISNDGTNVKVELNEDIKVDTVTANTVTAGQTSISNNGLAVGPNTSLKADELKVDGKTYIDKNSLNANDQKVTNVEDGKVEKDSKDAINGGQLFDTETKINNRIDGVENQVISNSNRIGQLSSRVNKVGAGAAALAALHPMDFDPDDKLTFSAGYGNYAGQNAAAIGAYYRPDEKVMFSVGGTVGNGENMVNAGISFSLDRTNHVSNSRTALAREVIDLRGQLAEMGAKMAKMEKAFGMLDESKTKLFPDIPANHWAYEYIAKLAGNGYIEGYPDGSFGGDRLMTRYEFATMLYRAIENGAALEERIIKEFEPELGRIRVDRISGEDGDRDKIERVRVNDTKGERDHYGNKLAK